MKKMLAQVLVSAMPSLIEQFTGEKMPQTEDGMTEIKLALSQIATLQQQIITGQQALSNRLVNLENKASNQLTNLAQQVQSIKSIRLTHDRERRQIEMSGNSFE